MRKSLIIAMKAMEKEGCPLTPDEIVNCMKGDDVFTLIGKTPQNTIGARLYVDIRDNPNSIFVQTSKRPPKFFLKKNLPRTEKIGRKKERKELIYAIEMFNHVSTGITFKIVKIGHTTNIKRTKIGYKRGNPECKLIGLWYANPDIKVTDCEKGVHLIAEKCGHRRKKEVFIFVNGQFNDFKSFVDLLLRRTNETEQNS